MVQTQERIQPSEVAVRRPFLRRFSPAILSVGVLLSVAATAPSLVPYNPLEVGVADALAVPSLRHPMGTDQLGRDVLSRVVSGSRISLGVAIASTSIATLVGAVLGAFAAWWRSWVDELIMRVLDMLMAFPGVLLAVVLAVALGSGWVTTITILGTIYVAPVARYVRAGLNRELQEDYILAARILGSSALRIAGYHAGVNIAYPLVAFAVTIAAEVIILEAALSFIGVGIQPPAPSWGNIISDGRQFIYGGQWWISTFAGAAVFVSVYALNSFGTALSNRLEAGELS